MAALEYLDRFKAVRGLTSDYAAAAALGVTRQAVSKWRSGIDTPGPLVAFELADTLGLPRDQVVAELEQERAAKAGRVDQASAWSRWVEKLSGATAAGLAAVILSGTPGSGNARPGAGLDRVQSAAGIHIVARRQRRRSAAAQALARLVDTLAGAPRVRLA